MKALVLILTLFTYLNAMEYPPESDSDGLEIIVVVDGVETASTSASPVSPIPSVKFADLYNRDTKVLNLSDIPLGNSGLLSIFESLKAFIEIEKVETLLLEHLELSEIPYYVITFTLISKTLRYVSMQHNNFRVKMLSPDSARRVSFMLDPQGAPSRAPSPIDPNYSRPYSMSNPTRMQNPIAAMSLSVVQGLWETIAPEIEKTLAEQNGAQNVMQYYKKIIIIDKNLPPITIINQDKLPVIDRYSKLKFICEKMVFISIGAFVVMLPTLLTYFLGKNDDGSNQ